ncbi:hypothetical protein TYRP_017104, partial [Tyrophagus putrescentiae]
KSSDDPIADITTSLLAFEAKHHRAATFEATLRQAIADFQMNFKEEEEELQMISPVITALKTFSFSVDARQVEAAKKLFEQCILLLKEGYSSDLKKKIDSHKEAALVGFCALLNALRRQTSKLRPPVRAALITLFTSKVNAIVQSIGSLLKNLGERLTHQANYESEDQAERQAKHLPAIRSLLFASLSLLKRIFSADYVEELGALVNAQSMTCLLYAAGTGSSTTRWSTFGRQHLFLGDGTDYGDYSTIQRQTPPKEAALGRTVDTTALVTALLKLVNLTATNPVAMMSFFLGGDDVSMLGIVFETAERALITGQEWKERRATLTPSTWENLIYKVKSRQEVMQLAYLALMLLWSMLEEVLNGLEKEGKNLPVAGGFSTTGLEELLLQLYNVFEKYSDSSNPFLRVAHYSQQLSTAERLLRQLVSSIGPLQIWQYFSKVDAAIEEKKTETKAATGAVQEEPLMLQHMSTVLYCHRPPEKAISEQRLLDYLSRSQTTAEDADENKLKKASLSAASSVSSLSSLSSSENPLPPTSSTSPPPDNQTVATTTTTTSSALSASFEGLNIGADDSSRGEKSPEQRGRQLSAEKALQQKITEMNDQKRSVE